MAPHHVLDEKNLLLRLRDGDRNAFTKLYHRYAALLAAKLTRLFRDEDMAQDVLQDTFIKVWERREQLEVDRNFGAFLFTIAANISNNVFRKQLRETTHRMQAEQGKAQNYTHVEEALDLKEQRDRLHNALQKLPPKQREVFILHKLEGKSYKEIGALLQIKESTINNHLQQATKRIQEIINGGLGYITFFFIFF